MKVLLQLFEFSYPGGYMFLDRSGELCRRVATRWPGLSPVAIEPTEVKLHGASMGLEVWVGVRTAALQVTSPMEGGFAEAAAGFASDVWDVLQLNMVESFRLKQVTGIACASKAEAAELMSPLVPRESQERLQGIAAQPEWRAVQAEYERDNVVFTHRFAVMDLADPEATLGTGQAPGGLRPYLTVHLEMRGLLPIPVASLDVAALVRHFVDHHSPLIAGKIAPHLA